MSHSEIHRCARQTPGGEQERNSQQPPNNAMQLTRGASEASGLRRPHHHLVPLAADRECSADLGYGQWLDHPKA